MIPRMEDAPKRKRRHDSKPVRSVEDAAHRVEASGVDVTQPNVRREVFAQEFVKSLDVGEAALASGASPYNAGLRGSALKGEPRVKLRILELMDERAIRTGITADKVLHELALIGFANVKDFMTWEDGNWTLKTKSADDIPDEVAAAIKEVWQDEAGKVRVKLYDKLQALDKIARHLGMFTQRVEIEARITGRVDVANGLDRLTTDELLNLRGLAEKMALPERSEVIDGDTVETEEA